MIVSLRHAVRWGMALTVIAGLTGPSAAQEPELLDLVKECDILAAHPSDSQRMAEGVSDDRIVPRLAIRACEQAIKDEPKDPRFTFQLGRALLAAGKKAEAAAEFHKSAEAGHAAGWAYLGDALQFGHGQAINHEKAREAYAKARDGGFERATELVNQLEFLPTMYAAGVMNQLYERNFAGIATSAREADRKWLTRAYLFALVQKLVTECDDVIPPTRIVALYTFRFGGGWSGETDAQTSVGIFTAVGEHDARIFLKRHGCEGLIAKHVFRAIDGFLSEFKES
jgi:TPR repeat protein